MKSFKTLIFLSIISFAGCTKSTDNTPVNTSPFGGDKGQTTIWSSVPGNTDYPITISVGGNYVGTISQPLSAAPDCQQANNAVVKFVAEPGTYNMVGQSGSGRDWTGTFTIKTGECGLVNLQ